MAEGDAELSDLYREVLVHYFRSASHKGKLEPADFRSHGVNPVCGDEVELAMTRSDGAIRQIRFTGHGCVISQASSAMMAEALEGRTLERAGELVAAFKDFMLGRSPVSALPEELGEVRALEGVRKFPVRVKCALLGWNTLLQGLAAGGAPGGASVAEFQETE